MDFLYDDEQDALREAVTRPGGQGVRRLREPPPGGHQDDPGFDEKQWAKMAEMGLLGLPFSEEDGGVGAGPGRDRHRLPGARPGDRARALPHLGGAGRRPGVRVRHRRAAPGGPRRPVRRRERAGLRPRRAGPRLDRRRAEQVTAAQDGDSWTLTGVKEPVPHGARADVLVVSAALPDGGTGLFVVDGRRAGPHRLPDVRRHAGGPGLLRRHRGDAAGRARRRPDRRASRRSRTSPG